jgi:hypothetical protein
VATSSLGIFVATHATATARTVFTPKFSARKGPQLKILDEHTVNAASVPRASTAALQKANRPAPVVVPAKLRTLEQQTSIARRAAVAPHNAGQALLGPNYPSTFDKFSGQPYSPSTCENSECLMPDPAVAAAPSGLALQVVNETLALYNNSGTLQSGWPKTAQAFFGVPNPLPSGCDTNGPYLFQARAWFDTYDNRFGVAMLQLEGAGGAGVPNCSFNTTEWVAVSNTNNPSGTWRVFSYAMNLTGGDPTGWAYLNEFGFDADGLFFSANIMGQSTTKFSFEYAEMIGCGKQAIYDGGTIVCNSYLGMGANNVNNTYDYFDSVQPVESLSTNFSPHAEYFVNTFDFNGDLQAHDCVAIACSGVAVWSWSDPANTSGSGNLLAGLLVSTAHSYVDPPPADQPQNGCTGGNGCLFTYYTGITGTPTYHAGHIFAAHETGVTNASSQFVPGIQWLDIVPTLTSGWPTSIDGVTEDQDGLLNGKNNWLACVNPVIMPDQDNDLILGFGYVGDTQFPSLNFTFRRVTDTPGTLPGGLGIIATAGTAVTNQGSLGMWSAMSYPAPYQDFIWLTGEYVTSTSGAIWNTELVKLRFNLNG